MLQKVSKRIFCLYNLSRAGIFESDITQVYISIIRSVIEYAGPVWHPGLSTAQSNEIERVQKLCLRLIYPERTYTEALLICGLDILQSRRKNITRDIIHEIEDENHILHSLLIKRKSASMAIRNSYPYKIPITKVSRYGRGFIPYCISKRFYTFIKPLNAMPFINILKIFTSRCYLLSHCSYCSVYSSRINFILLIVIVLVFSSYVVDEG